MKKKLLMLCSLILFIGCVKIDEGPKVIPESSNSNFYKVGKIDPDFDEIHNIGKKYSEIDIYKFEFDQHEYLFFNQGYGDRRSSACVHNPECKYCKNK